MDALEQQKLELAKLRKFNRQLLAECFDPVNLDSRPTSAQLEILKDAAKYRHRYVRAGNQSGKSQLAAREISWVLTGTHPYWTRPPEWGDEPLLIIIASRVSAQTEENQWRKIKAFLNPADYREVRTANVLTKVVMNSGDTIILASHHSPDEAAQKLQAYVAHWVWLDELPNDVRIIEELHRRVQAKQGRLIATFTPKVRNDKVRKLVDGAAAPLAKQYRLRMLDNPLYHGREADELQSISTLSADEQNSILYGDWFLGDEMVYRYNPAVHNEEPVGYSPAWRHLAVVDPAGASKLGLIVAAENPALGRWYPILAEYIPGNAGSILVEEVERRLQGLNIVERISDPHETWYVKEARLKGLRYRGVHKKDRKKELINGANTRLNESRVKIPSSAPLLKDELLSCTWNDNLDKIINGSRFHLGDCFQYMCDCLPPHEPTKVAPTFEGQLRRTYHERLEREQRVKDKKKQATMRFLSRRSRWAKRSQRTY